MGRSVEMNSLPRKLVGFLVLTIVACGAYAVPPAYEGPMGNPEEPALRPYKWFWRGMKALVYHPVKSLVEGNVKTPVLGTAEVFRGVRRGMVENEASIWMGMMGAQVRPTKEVGKANKFIEDDILLRNVADYVAASYAMGIATGEIPVSMWDGGPVEYRFKHWPLGLPVSPLAAPGLTSASFSPALSSGVSLAPKAGNVAYKLADGIWLSQKLLDHHPANADWEETLAEAKAVRAAKARALAERKSVTTKKQRIEKARKKYLRR